MDGRTIRWIIRDIRTAQRAMENRNGGVQRGYKDIHRQLSSAADALLIGAHMLDEKTGGVTMKEALEKNGIAHDLDESVNVTDMGDGKYLLRAYPMSSLADMRTIAEYLRESRSLDPDWPIWK